MQEPGQAQQPQQTEKRKPLFALGVAAIAVVVLLAALFIAHSIINNSYTGHLDRLKGMVADTSGQIDRGDTDQGATAEDQYRFYMEAQAQTANLADILKKLNDSYPLLLTKADEQRAGIADLQAKVDALAPDLATFKECIDEDSSITGKLAGLIGKPDTQSSEYTELQSGNAALGSKIAGLAFTGALEDSRKALADSAAKRGTALDFLIENAKASEQFAALMADTGSAPADHAAKLTELQQKNDGLEAQAASAGLDAYGAAGTAMAGQPAQRKGALAATIAYLNELGPVQQSVLQFNGKIEQGVSSGSGKFAQKLAAWMAWVKDLNTLKTQLTAVNGKPEYAEIPNKRTLTGLGLSETGQSLGGYSGALSAMNSAMASSATIEKEIDATLKNTKLRLVERISKLEDLTKRNDAILAKIAVELPPDLADGLANFAAACMERKVFLSEYMGYAEDKVLADGHKASRSNYLSQYSYYKNMANTHPADADFYNDMASQQSKLASDELAKYNASLKDANAHKTKYEASRKKYVPMLGK